jgi:diaminohydroxyphosphoribosylaminopyrimidine deaminase/5-amino-6-(5-phosphoribosylamino)uracil reductase
MSSNGMISQKDKKPVRLTCQKSNQLVHKLRNKNQAILIGINTVLSDNPHLTCRLERKKKRNPLRIVLDSELRIPKNSKITKNKNFLIATCKKTSIKKLEAWKKANIWISPTEKKVSLTKLLKFLGSQGVSSVLLEGGRTVIDNFFTEKLIDEIYMFISPKTIESGLPWSIKKKEQFMKSINSSIIGSDTLIHGIF